MNALRLIATPEAPVPDGATVQVFEGAGGAPLRAALFTPQGPVRGSILLSPGRAEPIEKYFEVIGELLDRGFVVLAHDWRGQGLSHRLLPDRCRGHCQDWRHYADDHRALLDAFEARLPRPRIALAHSMGGCFVSLALPSEPRIDAAVFSAPMFGIALAGLPLWVSQAVIGTMCALGLGNSYVELGGGDPLKMPFDNNVLTSDRGRWDRYHHQLRAAPELKIGGATWGWMRNAMAAMAAAGRAAPEIGIPLLVIAAGDERLVLNAPAKAFAGRAPRGRYVEIEGSRHELMMERDPVRAQFWALFDGFVAGLKPPNA